MAPFFMKKWEISNFFICNYWNYYYKVIKSFFHRLCLGLWLIGRETMMTRDFMVINV